MNARIVKSEQTNFSLFTFRAFNIMQCNSSKRILLCTVAALASGLLGGYLGGQISVAALRYECQNRPIALPAALCQVSGFGSALWQGVVAGLWTGTILGAYAGSGMGRGAERWGEVEEDGER